MVFKTVNGGATWTNITPDATLVSGSQHQLGVSADGKNLLYWTLAFSQNPSQPRFMYRSTDGGASWSDNIFPATINNEPVTNFGDILYSDANNIVAFTGPNKILLSNDGGLSWRFEEAPSGSSFQTGHFIPKVVPPGTPMENRRLLVAGGQILEFGKPNLINRINYLVRKRL
jgi:photosystem II stability/assembly factor-like uncharacterized protein